MDIYEYIKRDHQYLSTLFKLFETAKTKKNQLETVHLILKELFIHAQSEQKTFYQALECHADAAKMINHAEHEHLKIQEKVQKLQAQNIVNDEFIKTVLELKNLVDHHVAEEENRIFNKAKKVLSEEEAIILKEQMHFQKQKLLNQEQFKKILQMEEA